MTPWHGVFNIGSARQMLAWSALIAIAVLLGLLLHSLVANALITPGPAARPDACQSTAGAALADGDDVRARFLARVCGTAVSYPSP